MSPSAVQFSSNLSVPAKSFVLGEYAVLSGGPALVATFGPRFVLNRGSGRADFPAASPAGRLLARAASDLVFGFDFGFDFDDPFGGQGGFGASTAQFALVYASLAADSGWDRSALGARRFYRELMVDEVLPPSGADLVAQWSGGVVQFDPLSETVTQRFSALDWRDLLVFSAAGQPGRKVPTHEHLSKLELPSTLLRGLRPILDRGLELRDGASLGQAMTEYARVLANVGLEIPAARADREALGALPGVLGAKGTGALLADGMLVLLEPDTSSRESVIAAAQARGLRLVANGLGARAEAGL